MNHSFEIAAHEERVMLICSCGWGWSWHPERGSATPVEVIAAKAGDHLQYDTEMGGRSASDFVHGIDD